MILAAYSVFLKGVAKLTYRALISERELGREFFLGEFVAYVEIIVGHASWNSIATGIEAVHFALGKPAGVTTNADGFKTMIRNFRSAIRLFTRT